jgi:peptide/nickel transport system permease protein
VREVVVKTVLLCVAATFGAHLLLMFNPVVADRTIHRLESAAPGQSEPAASMRRALEADVHAQWLASDSSGPEVRVRQVFRFWMERDMAVALAKDPNLQGEESRSDQRRLSFYAQWLAGVVRGELGYGSSGQAIGGELRGRLPTTFAIALVSLILTAGLAIYGGFAQALRPRSWLGRGQDLIFYAVSAVPAFLVGTLFLRVFGLERDGTTHLGLPIVTLIVSNGLLAELLVSMKVSLEDAFGQNYVLGARAKGLSEWWILTRHVFRNAAIEFLPRVSEKMPFVVGGTIVVEKAFSLNGLADMLIDGLGNHDNARVLVVILVSTLLVRIGTVIADGLLYALDPRQTAQAAVAA